MNAALPQKTDSPSTMAVRPPLSCTEKASTSMRLLPALRMSSLNGSTIALPEADIMLPAKDIILSGCIPANTRVRLILTQPFGNRSASVMIRCFALPSDSAAFTHSRKLPSYSPCISDAFAAERTSFLYVSSISDETALKTFIPLCGTPNAAESISSVMFASSERTRIESPLFSIARRRSAFFSLTP